jgi:hypothetical protein
MRVIDIVELINFPFWTKNREQGFTDGHFLSPARPYFLTKTENNYPFTLACQNWEQLPVYTVYQNREQLPIYTC